MDKVDFEYLCIDDFTNYNRDLNEPKTVEDAFKELKNEFPYIDDSMIKCLLGIADDQDIAYLQEQQNQVKQALEEKGYNYDETTRKFTFNVGIEDFTYNKLEDYEFPDNTITESS